jgi:site-specific recombinase XerD
VRQAEVHIARIRQAFGSMQLSAVRPSHVRTWTSQLAAEGLSESYVYALHARLAQLYSDAVHDGLVAKSPCSRRTSPGAGKQRPYVATTEQVWALHDVMPEHLRASILLGAFAGLRVAEACGLLVTSVTESGGYDSIQFIGKGGKYADIPLPVPVMRAVREIIGDRTEGPLLLNEAGNRMTEQDARRMVKRIGKVASCPEITPHGLRRTFCTSGLVSGVPLREMQIAMRHSDPRTTGLYDMAKHNKDRHASHRVASFLAGMT